MNWIPKEKSAGRKPTEMDRMKDYFRRHRPPVEAAASAPTDELPKYEESPRSSSRRSSGDGESRDPSSSSTGEAAPVPLSEMNLRGLSQTIREPTASISSELVHLEMMKKIFHYQPRERSPEPEGEQTDGRELPQEDVWFEDAAQNCGN
ncbi:hypothetical protein BV898_01521 [Hypsibius exemplaris]|uniref:Uncharacterized protein n=1 Tax=Hypsibius exemplaris TaxID=2072580 RepID=A0A1W0XAA7_HYPEX|nr:hypothetical protein BV898_01521 [Hypsibius exemplaris]